MTDDRTAYAETGTPEDVTPFSPSDGEVAGAVPGYRFSRSLSVLSEPGGVRAESIGALRTHLLAQHIRDGKRSLAICTPAAGSGCSYVAANLAAAIALTGMKTLLIDANLREPGLGAYIKAEDETAPGLVQFLSDPTLGAGDVIRDDVLPNLSLIYAGRSAANAQELLGGARFKGLIDDCVRDFDLTLIDTPPSNTCADARRVAAVVRHSLIVVRRNRSFVADVKVLAEELHADHAHVLGTFLNDY